MLPSRLPCQAMRGNGQARPHGYGVICCRCWVLLRVPVGKIMAPFAPVLVPLLRVEGELTLTDTQADLWPRPWPPRSTGCWPVNVHGRRVTVRWAGVAGLGQDDGAAAVQSLDEGVKNPGRVIGPEGLQGRFRGSSSRSPQQYLPHAQDEGIRHHSVLYLLLLTVPRPTTSSRDAERPGEQGQITTGWRTQRPD